MRATGSASARRRALAWIVFCAAALLLAGALVLAAHVLLGSPTGVASVVRIAATLAGVEVRLRSPNGRLADRFGLEQIDMRVGATRIVVDHLQARVGHWSLWPLRVAFESIHASNVELHVDGDQVQVDGDRQSHWRPQRIAAPLQWEIGELQIDAFEYWKTPDSAAVPLRFRSIRAGLLSSPGGYRLGAGRLQTGDVEMEVEGTLGAQWPFPLQANGQVRSRLAQRPVQADLTASGSLDQLDLSVRLIGSEVGGRLQAHLTSFATPSLTRVEADLQGVDPAHWIAGAPHAQLDVRIDLRSVAGWASELAGTFDALNRADGTLDAQRLPVRGLRGALVADFDSATGTTIKLPAIEAELERGSAVGRLEIGARSGIERWSLDAALRQVDLSGLHSRVRPLRVDGTLHLENRPIDSGAGFAARGDLHAKDPAAAELTFDLEGGVDRLRLASAHLALNAGTFDAQGLFDRRTNHLQLRGAARSLDAGLMLRTLRSRLDGHFDIDAALSPEPHGVGRFELVDSRICWPATRCWPAHGQGVVELSPGRLLHADIGLVLHSAQLRARGALATSQGRLEIEVTVPQLADLDAALHGTVQAHAILSGPWDAPEVDLHADLQGLRASGQSVGSVSLDLRGKAQRDAPFDLNALVEAVGPEAGAAPWVQTGSVHVQGSVRDHTVSLQAAIRGERHLTLLARGGFAGKGWTGVLAQAQVDGPQPLQLSETASLAADGAGFSLGPAQLRVLGASVRDARLEVGPQGLRTQGRFTDLQLPQAAPMVGLSLASPSDPLVLRGQWDLALGEYANGELAIERQSGDLQPSLEATPPPALGLRELSAAIRLVEDRLEARFSMDSERAGSLNAMVQATLQRGQDRHWGLAGDQPWRVEASARLPAIEALNPLFSQRVRGNLRLAGQLAASLRIEGTAHQPQASGTIEGDGLRVAWVDQGMRLENGHLRARVAGDWIEVDQIRFEGPLRVPPADSRARNAIRGELRGTVSATGRVRLSDLTGSLQIQAQQLLLLQRADRWLVASGGANVELQPRRVRLSAAMKADAGFIDLSRPDIPTLSDDVRVIAPDSGPPAAPPPGLEVSLDLGMDLGSAFYLRGSGLNARVTGPLRLQGEGQGPLRTSGAVSIEEGIYEGFGQRLSIRYGRINFQGAADNPSLDVLAVRTDLPVEVGVAVTGTVARPVVRLHSDPPLPDYEALSWLALGRPPGDPRIDNVALARLATGLLSGSGEGIPTRLARSIGIDEVTLRTADAKPGSTLLPRQSVAGKLTTDDTTGATTASSQIISLGHRINDVITVSYEQAVSGASNVVQVSYQLSKRLSLIGRAGSDNALNLVFSLPFD